MKILFLAQRVPYPPNKGDKLRSFNEIKFLSRYHDISLVCLADNCSDLQQKNELLQYCCSVDIVYLSKVRSKINTAVALFTKKPLTLSNFYSARLKEIVHQKLRDEKFDLIFVYCSSMAQYVENITNIPRMIDFVDVDSEKWVQYVIYARFPMNLIYGLESRRLRAYEKIIAQSFQYCFLVSEKEVDDFRSLVCPIVTLTHILNGVDLEQFQPSTEPYDPNVIVFTGAMDYFANVEAVNYFALEILPSIKLEIPDVKFYVVGSNPAAELLSLASNNPNIIVTGYVDQVQPYMAQAAVFVAPMRIARGVQNKILEAMSMGVPVVTTSLGFEGISAIQGRDIFVEDLPEQFANRVVQLINDKDLRRTISSNAREVVENQYNWDNNLNKLHNAFIKSSLQN